MPPLERHLSLIQVLLSQNKPVTKEYIRSKVEEYKYPRNADSTEDALAKMFERDKRDLLEMGIPIETRPTDVLSDVEDGYIINKEKFFLPTITISARERALLAKAKLIWVDDTMRKTTSRAVQSVTDVDTGSEQDLDTQVTLTLSSPGVHEILKAISYKKQISFNYRSATSTNVHQRTLDPWQLFVFRGYWYVIGYCAEHPSTHTTFKLSRILGEIEVLETKQSHPEPDDFSITDVLHEWELSAGGSRNAKLAVTKGEGGQLRRFATKEASGTERDELEISYGSELVLARIIAQIADLVIVHEPQSLKDAVSAIVAASQEVHES